MSVFALGYEPFSVLVYGKHQLKGRLGT